MDVFLRENPDIASKVRCSIEILESFDIDVSMYYNYTNIISPITIFQISDFSNFVNASNHSTGSTVSVIWNWRWLVAEIAAAVSEDENIS